MSEMNAEKARGIVAAKERTNYEGYRLGEAKGYLAALEGPECKALVKAAESVRKYLDGWMMSWTELAGQKDVLDNALSAFQKAAKP